MADKKLTIHLDPELLVVLDVLRAYRGVPKRAVLSEMIESYMESHSDEIGAARIFVEKREAMRGGG